MTESIDFLDDIQSDLKQIIQPYQRELKLRQKKADFVNSCIRCAGRDDFLRLDELLKSKLAKDIADDEAFGSCVPLFESLGQYADERVEEYRIELVDDLTRLCDDAGLEIEIDFPRFTVLRGIDGEIDFAERCTRINKKVLKSIDPRRILTAAQKWKQQLYDKPYDPQKFIDSLCRVYLEAVEQGTLKVGGTIPMQTFYLAYVISLQSKPFFQNMDKGKFKGYSLEQFSVDMWRYYEAGIGGTSDGYTLQLTPGRNKALWFLDSQGELRQFSGISFQRQGA